MARADRASCLSRAFSSVLIAVLGVALAGCAPGGQRPESSEAPAGREPGRTPVVALRVEPTTLASQPLAGTPGLSRAFYPALFNATLTSKDQDAVPRPYLAEGLPELRTESWRVLPDGGMETTYRLRPGLVWHDGTPLSTEDFVFGWRVYSTPELGRSATPPHSIIEAVETPGDRTVVIRWRQLYASAGTLGNNFPPLPRHLLEQALLAGSPDAFVAHPYWGREHVGLGPFFVDRWEPGAFLEARAFERFIFGRPRVDRMKLVFIGDPNTVLANLLAGEVHLAIEDSIRFQQGSILRREWAASGAGLVQFNPTQWRFIQVQLRPEYAAPRAILDVRFRKALAYAIDKQALSDGLFEGLGVLTDSMIPAGTEYFPAVDRAIAKYPFDLRRSEQIMAEAGFAKGPEGFYLSPPDGRLDPEIKTIAASQNEAEMSTLASSWRQAGIDAQEAVLSPAQAQDSQIRSTFRTLHLNGGPVGEGAVTNQLTSARIPKPENRWSGSNRGAWVNPEYDRLAEELQATLDPGERQQRVVQAVKIYSEELPAISLYFQLTVIAHTATLRGLPQITPEGSVAWNVHQWELR